MRRSILLIAVICLTAMCFTTICYAVSFVWPADGALLTEFVTDVHRGIDIAAENGQPILSADDGTVFSIGRTPRGEPYVSIEHTGSITSTYLPVKSCVKVGQQVSAGSQIGVLGSEIDPSADVSHLHFGIYDSATRGDKTYLDPCSFLPPHSEPASSPKSTQEASTNSALEIPEATEVSAIQTEHIENVDNAQVISKPETVSEYHGVVSSELQAVTAQNPSTNQASSSPTQKPISELSNPTNQQRLQTRGIEVSSINMTKAANGVRQPIVYHETPKGTVEPGIAVNQYKAQNYTNIVTHSTVVSQLQMNALPDLSASKLKTTAISTARVHNNPSLHPANAGNGSDEQLMSSRRVIDWPYLSTLTLMLSMTLIIVLSIKNYMRSAPRMPALISSY